MADFKVGDVVMLKSGGPPMTVVKIDSSPGKVACSWFPSHTSEKSSREEFVPDAIREFKPPR